MYKLTILLVIALAGIIIFVTFNKGKPPWILFVVVSIGLMGTFLLIGYRFSASSALPMGSKIIESIDTNYGKALLYQDENENTFGLAKINRKLGFIYHYDGGTSDYSIEGNEPFKAAGFGNDEEDGFMVGVITSNPNIKYIVVGNHLENLTTSSTYNFNMKTVKKYPDNYHIKEVVANHAFFVFNEYSEATWTIRALDNNGNLVADKLFETGEARYID